MLGDILLINELHKAAAQSLLEVVTADREKKLSQDPNYKYIIAISGESGAGKSELSHSLALLLKGLNIRVKVIHADNYYGVPPLLRKEWRIEQGLNVIGPNEYDWDLLHKNIREFKEDMIARIPCIDIIPEQTDELITDFQKINLLIVDGLYAIKANEVDLRIFIELTYKETKMMQLMRGKEEVDEFRSKILEREHVGVMSLRPLANIIINKNYDVVIEKMD
ncbi:MAG: uridine kinase [Bacteroidetes bacterium HGW-Bacteroidetes-15]|nr:MAG: uridine kinase [Bacteroidetes bacterium HGW-Bacteroidetes-15]